MFDMGNRMLIFTTKRIIVFFILFSIYTALVAQPQELSAIQWQPIERGMEMAAKYKRPLFIDAYTHWCGWCKKMDKEVFQNQQIINYINNNYIPVKYNAENQDTITINNKVYKDTTINKRHIHQLSIALLDGRFSYPTLVYIDREGRKYSVPGYSKAKGLWPRLAYYAEDVYKSGISYENYKQQFDKVFPDGYNTTKSVKDTLINWINFEDAIKKNTENPKKIIVDFYYPYSITGKLMQQITYNNSVIADYINKNFYAARLDVTTKRKIQLDKVYVNTGESHQFHQLAIQLLQGNMYFPSIVFIDENNTQFFTVRAFQEASQLNKMLQFIGTNKYKEMSWNDYQKK